MFDMFYKCYKVETLFGNWSCGVLHGLLKVGHHDLTLTYFYTCFHNIILNVKLSGLAMFDKFYNVLQSWNFTWETDHVVLIHECNKCGSPCPHTLTYFYICFQMVIRNVKLSALSYGWQVLKVDHNGWQLINMVNWVMEDNDTGFIKSRSNHDDYVDLTFTVVFKWSVLKVLADVWRSSTSDHKIETSNDGLIMVDWMMKVVAD